MDRKITVVIVLLSLVSILAACAGQPAATESKPVTAAPPAQSTPGTVLPATTQSPPITAAAQKPAGPIKAKEITPAISGDTVSIPLKDIQNNWNSHFLVNAPGGTTGFMAYVLDNVVYVRASVCPPCRGKTYTLDGTTLVCDICATTFNANTGAGIAGACVNYPKAPVPHQVVEGNLTMKISDLTAAYQNTLKPGLP